MHIYTLNIYIDTYMNINYIFIYAVCCKPFLFSHFYVKKAYLLLTLPMFRISAGSFHPPFSDLAVTAGTVGTRRLEGPDPGGIAEIFP